MDEYRDENWSRAAELFRKAAVEDCSYYIARTNLASVLALQKKFEKSAAALWRALKLDPERTMQKLEKDPDYRLLKQYTNFYAASSPVGLVYHHYCYRPARPEEIDPDLLRLISKTRLKRYANRYTVATRYAFETDFNGNAVADRVYPLLLNRFRDVLIVFDGDRVDVEGCTSTPLGVYDMARNYKIDPCDIEIRSVVDRENKHGIVIQAGDMNVPRTVCR